MTAEIQPAKTAQEIILENMAGPKRVTVAGETVEQHSIDDQIKALDYLAGEEAAKHPHFGLRFTKLILPGTG